MARERLQKLLAAAGVASRRASEQLIDAGRVTVDGRVAQLGDSADPEKETILLDGRPIAEKAAPVHLALHKPVGVTSTVRDPHATSTVIDLVPTAFLPPSGRLYPVGRLDRDSEGLILLTNDGPWAELVSHPRHGVDREYAVALRHPLNRDQRAALEAGIELDEGVAHLVRLRPLTDAEINRLDSVVYPPIEPGQVWYAVILRQGWRRQIRRMFAAVEAPVVRLVRVRVGQVRLERLASGRVRPLTDGEVRALAGEPPPRRRRPKPGAKTGAKGGAKRGAKGGAKGGSRPKASPGGRSPGGRYPRPR